MQSIDFLHADREARADGSDTLFTIGIDSGTDLFIFPDDGTATLVTVPGISGLAVASNPADGAYVVTGSVAATNDQPSTIIATFETGAATILDLRGLQFAFSWLQPFEVHVTVTGDAATVFGTSVADIIDGGTGNDILVGGGGTDRLTGNDGDDVLIGGDPTFGERDVLAGGDGNDVLIAGANDDVNGGAGYDMLYTEQGSGAWHLDLGATAIEWVQASNYGDVIDAASQTAGVTLFGNGGADHIVGSSFDDFLWVDGGAASVAGGAGNDVLFGGAGTVSLSGGDGDDVLVIASSSAAVDGGAGYDIAYLTDWSSYPFDLAAAGIEVLVDLSNVQHGLSAAGSATSVTIAANNAGGVMIGGSAGDYLWGGTGNDEIHGGPGDDTLVGGTGADWLKGGEGNDMIVAGAGVAGDGVTDIIIFDAPAWGLDFVYGFEVGRDFLAFAGSGLAAADVTITAIDGSAYVSASGSEIVVVGAAALTTADMIF